MADLNNYFRQHKEISELISNIKTMINADITKNSKDIAMALNSLSGKLKIHLSMEDKYLYPSLKTKENTKTVAEKFEKEMGDLAKEFLNYKDKYNTSVKIIENPNDFSLETGKILKTLEDRMSKEEKNLYPIA